MFNILKYVYISKLCNPLCNSLSLDAVVDSQTPVLHSSSDDAAQYIPSKSDTQTSEERPFDSVSHGNLSI